METLDTIIKVLGLLGIIFLFWHRWVIHPRGVSDAYMRGWQDGLSNRDFPTYKD